MKKNNSKMLTILGVLLVFSILFQIPAIFAAADSYPSKPIRLIIPFAPGGSNDIVGRLIADKLTERLGKQVIVDNRGGAGGVLGAEMVAKASPDGYTLLIASASYAFNPALDKSPFDPLKAFTPIARLGSGPISLVVHPSLPVNSVLELITLAKKEPGKLILSCSGAGSAQHLAAELFKLKTRIDFKIVQFKGGGPAMIDLLGGHSNFQLGSLIQTLPYVKSGKFKLLATGGSKRFVKTPDVPTIAEAGVTGYEATNWWGILAPAGTSAPIVDRLSKELKAILALNDVKDRFVTEGAEVDYIGPAEFGLFIADELIKWDKVVKEANVKME
jgi:tripartite-type tricarboxylate transporter receptor subunit TctC